MMYRRFSYDFGRRHLRRGACTSPSRCSTTATTTEPKSAKASIRGTGPSRSGVRHERRE